MRKSTTLTAPPFDGLTLLDICKQTGLPYPTVYRHAFNQRRISAEVALVYHRALGIPLHELRPDLWPPADNEQTTDTQEAADGAAC